MKRGFNGHRCIYRIKARVDVAGFFAAWPGSGGAALVFLAFYVLA